MNARFSKCRPQFIEKKTIIILCPFKSRLHECENLRNEPGQERSQRQLYNYCFQPQVYKNIKLIIYWFLSLATYSSNGHIRNNCGYRLQLQ